MFGLIYAAIKGILFAVTGVQSSIEEQQCIERGKERARKGTNVRNLYYDRKGATRDIETRELRSIDYIGRESEGKDQYLRDKYGHPVKNLSEERRQERLTEAKNDPRRTVAEWKKDYANSKLLAGYDGRPYYSGNIYKDLETGREFLCRRFSFPYEVTSDYGGGVYYMDTLTGLLVREADSMIFERNNGTCNVPKEVSKKFIEYFNNKQKNEGYFLNSNIPVASGWDNKESEWEKRNRMCNFYCNKFSAIDIPARRNL